MNKELFKCKICGYVDEANEKPQACLKCGAPSENLYQLDKEYANRIYSADRTNDIHMEIISLASKIQKLCEEGVIINLDASCVSVFEKAKDETWIVKQRSKAEIDSHCRREKW